MLAPFGMQPKGTVQARMLPMAQALAARGHMVRVVVPPWDDPNIGRGARRTEAIVNGVHIVTLGLPRRMPWSIALTRGLVQEALHPKGSRVWETDGERDLAGFRAEIVHVFKPIGYSGLSAFVLRAMRVPWLLDVDDWEGRGGWADVNPYSLPQKLSISVMENALPRLAQGVTAASKTLEARAWNLGLPKEKVTYLPNGVWRGKYEGWADVVKANHLRADFHLMDVPVVVLYTRFDVFPVEWIARIMQRIRGTYPHAHLLVIGRGFRAEEVELQALFHVMGMEDNITLAGFVEGRDLAAYLSMGDVCIYPMEDTLLNRAKSPVKVLEPMLVGVPMVAHRVGEAAQFLGDSGVLVRHGDVEGIGDAVTALLGDRERSAQLGAAAQARVWNEFGWDKLSARLEAAYARTTDD